VDYYFLEYRQADHAARITLTPDTRLSAVDWQTGSRLATAPAIPVTFQIQPGDEGDLPPYVDDPIPLMSDALIAALRQAGADNFQVFEAVIQPAAARPVVRGYYAVNILGLVNCADDEETAPSPLPAIDVRRTHDLALFRLAGYARKIVVHRRMKDRLQSQAIGASLDFRSTGTVMEARSDDARGEPVDDASAEPVDDDGGE
jgi:hypothetical protein